MLIDTQLLLKPPGLCSTAAYTGHYVVVHGYDSRRGEFLVKDPSAVIAARVPAEELEAARKAFGTDEDLLFVPVGTAGHGGDGGGEGAAGVRRSPRLRQRS